MGLAATLVLALALVLALQPRRPQPVRTISSHPAIGGDFDLTSDLGAKVNQTLLKGKWTAVFFGYTFCPDVCPTTLTALGGAVQDLSPANAKAFQVIFITVDPERDTANVLRRYLSADSFPKGVIGLTGTPSQITKVAKAYHVYYQKVPQGGSYVIDHTAVVYLMNPDGAFVAPLDVTKPPADIAREIDDAMAGQT